jgi:predicted DNA-binding helix-hairpin-helix protein
LKNTPSLFASFLEAQNQNFSHGYIFNITQRLKLSLDLPLKTNYLNNTNLFLLDKEKSKRHNFIRIAGIETENTGYWCDKS